MHRALPRVLLALAVLTAACTSGATTAPTAGSAPTTAAGSTSSTTPSEAAPNLPQADSRPLAPEFPEGLAWLNTDRPLTLEELRGRVVVLDFWTYGCINCIHIIPDLKRLEEEFGDTLVVIGVHSAKFDNEGNTENIREVILRYGLEHPVVNDADFLVWQTWGARAWPTLVLIDPLGRVVGSHAGEGVYEIFRPAIAAVAAESLEHLATEPLDFALEQYTSPETLLRYPGKVLAEGDRLFVADSNHHRIVMATLHGEVLDVFGTGSAGFVDGPEGSFNGPQGMALSEDGSTLYVADTLNHSVRAVDIGSGVISTIAGTGEQGTYPPTGGAGPETALYSPWDLDRNGDLLVVAMAGSHQIWSLDLTTLETSPYAGSGGESVRNGPVATAELAQPSGVEVVEGVTYFADSESSSIRYTDGETVALLAGTDANLFDFGDADGTGVDARFQHPLGVAAAGGVLYVADTYNSRIRAIDLATGVTTTLAGGEAGWRDGADSRFYEPGGLDELDGVLYIADTNNHSIRRYDLETGIAGTVVFKGLERFAARPGTEGYRGTTVTLPEMTVAAGPVTIELSVEFPDGYKVNPEAPSSFLWSGSGIVVPEDASGSVVDPSFPLTFVIDAAADGELVGDVSVVYCDETTESICLFEQVRMTVPLEVSASGETTLELLHTIVLPKGLG